MFNPFKKKRSGDIIDLTALQKRGLLKEASDVQKTPQQNPSFFDLPAPQPSDSPPPVQPASSEQVDTGFFSAMASSAEPTPSYQENQPLSSQNSDANYQNKDKIDKIEGRVEHILDRIYKILQRIEIMERKIERLERRSGLGGLESY